MRKSGVNNVRSNNVRSNSVGSNCMRRNCVSGRNVSSSVYKYAAVFLMTMALLFAVGSKALAASGSSSMGASSSSVNIGDSVSVTMNVSADVYASFRMNVSYDSGVLEYTGTDKSGDCNGGGGALSVLSEVDGGGTYSITLKFKAIAPGEASVSASAVEAFAMETAEAISISGSGANVTVNNAASDNGGSSDNSGNAGAGENAGGENSDNAGGENGNGDGNGSAGGNAGGEAAQPTPQPVLSADNSLQKLVISPGKLSPEFKYSTTKYTASVGADVTEVAVDAKTSNSKATVESVSGNTNLQPGENAIKIVVKAENGTLATYTILVTRGGAGETMEEDTQEEPEEDNTTELPAGIQINGISYEPAEKLPVTEMPEEFEKATTTYGGKEIEAYFFSYGNLFLTYLNPAEVNSEEESAEESGIFAFYNGAANEFFPYININVGEKYALVLPNSFADVIPEGYQETTLTVNGFTVNGCQQTSAEDGSSTEFYLLYCVDKTGAAGWYQYDAADMSLQRFNENAVQVVQEAAEEDSDVDITLIQEAYQKLENKYKEEKASSRTIIAVLVFLLVVAVVVIVNLLIFRKAFGNKKTGLGKNGDMDYIDFDDF